MDGHKSVESYTIPTELIYTVQAKAGSATVSPDKLANIKAFTIQDNGKKTWEKEYQHVISDIQRFIPDNVNPDMIDEILQIGNETAFATAREAASKEGLPLGISSGASIAAALEVGARAEMENKMIVAIAPSFAERYLSTALFDGLGNE